MLAAVRYALAIVWMSVCWLPATAPAGGTCCCARDCRCATPVPVGTYCHMWQCGQIRSARQVLAIHLCDWNAGTTQLSPFMRRYLASRIGTSPESAGPSCVGQIVIQPSETRTLDQQRRVAVIEYLNEQGLPLDFESVVVGYSTRDRLRGEDANRALENFGYQRARAQSTTFNPYAGYVGPNGGFAPITNQGTLFPAIPGLFGP